MTIFFIITIAVCVSVIAYFSAIWIFADCVVTIQNISGLKALSASNRAAKIHFLETFLYMIIYGIITFLIGLSIAKILEGVSVFLSDNVYLLCCMVWSFLRYIVFDGFFIMILVVLFLNRIWANTQNSTYINDIKGEITSQTEQQNTNDLEKIPKIEQQNTINLEKTSEQNAEQNQNKTDDIEKH